MPLVRLIRHGQSASNAGEATEHPDTIPLTALGHAQASVVASCFHKPPARVIFSYNVRRPVMVERKTLSFLGVSRYNGQGCLREPYGKV